MPLLDGGYHSATPRVIEPTSLLALSRADFAALVSRSHPTAFVLKRRIAAVACARLRAQLAALAESLGDEGALAPAPETSAQPISDLEFCGPPDSEYVHRLATFRSFDSLALWGFPTAGRDARCPAGRMPIAEGAASTACYLTHERRGREGHRSGRPDPGGACGPGASIRI